MLFSACDESSQSNDGIENYTYTGGAAAPTTGGSATTPTVTGGTGDVATGGTGDVASGGTIGVVTGGAGGSSIDASASTDGGQTLSVDSGTTVTTEASVSAEASAGEDAVAEASVSPEGSIDTGIPTGGECTRGKLRATLDATYTALAAHDSSSLPLAATVKYTENGEVVQVGQGLWQTAGELVFARSALDTGTCSTVSESTIKEANANIILGLRLKLENDQITEIEAIIVRGTSDYFFVDTSGIERSTSDDWEALLPVDQQPTRDRLQFIVEFYFSNFPSGLCDLAPGCMRYEDGRSPGGCDLMVSCGAREINSRPAMPTRLTVLDTETGIAVAFTMFMGGYTDFHMFKVGADDQIHGVHAILASARSSGWD
jgi:hypothetical protein